MSVVVSTSARPRAGTVNLLSAGVLWGTGGIAGSVLAATAGLSSLSVAACRLVLGGLFTVAALGVLGRLRGVPRTPAVVRRVLITGGLLALFQACYFASVAATSVGIATMATIGSVPVFVAGASAVRQRCLPDAITSLCVAGAVTGLVLLTWSPEGTAERGRFVAGLVAALVSGAGFATLTLATRTRVAGLDPVRTTGFGCLLGGALLLPAAVWSGLSIPLHWDVLAAACYLGAVPTALAYAAYFRGLRTAPPVFAALAALLEPLTATVLSVLLLGDRLGVTGWCGAALLLTAVAAGYLRR
ncbi:MULTISPECIES: DMT family transporter [Prauserella salsuginis group]|uniref:DME family drug/metabolite transporter n=2 Tax=Prauserella salsuginis group TaxID=2893672 RepID=A0A839XHY3_9PSEU|nr:MULTISPECIES: EamA family transporter [Prauserella salsuginis group]MBB3661154.1 DME family drug/metabolite transporter [Prauserella sediminis]MCR3719017.1 drug/metabolite transporter, DME family [Prauserella flava]MCR3733587.1 drug/metabolite transporter, DME family [Prauserella salsuginis]